MAESIASICAMLAIELGLFAAIIFAVFAVDDLVMDGVWIATHQRPKPLPPADSPILRCAVFVPVWGEAAVIGPMLATLCTRWPSPDVTVFVGVYPNDPATEAAVRDAMAHDPRIHMVIGTAPGPTTKGANLNQMWRTWRAMQADDAALHYDVLVLHDAEDMVDPGELRAFTDALRDAEFAQIPVEPLHRHTALWVGGHYADEFAVSHRRDLAVRAAINAPVPLAGAGCAVRWEWLERLDHGDGPFPADSLTEDYELGIRLSALGARGVLARYRDGWRRVTSRAYFPRSFNAAVRQKSRWLLGNALNGWDRLGWVNAPDADVGQRIIAHWTLWRDRRALLSALAVLLGYAAFLLMLVAIAIDPVSINAFLPQEWLIALWSFNLVNLGWRLIVRCACVLRDHGPVQALLAIPRLPVSNVILICTAVRAVWRYRAARKGAPQHWDKTEHEFPEDSGVAQA